MIFHRMNFEVGRLCPKPEGQPAHLSGVHMTEAFTEVTNGHYLVRVTCPDGVSVDDAPRTKHARPFRRKKINVILPKDSAAIVVKSIGQKKKSWGPAVLNLAWVGSKTSEGETEILTTDLETTRSLQIKNVDAKFPNVASIVKRPRKKPKAEIGFSVSYMEDLCAFLRAADIKNARLRIYDERSPMRIDGCNVETVQVGIVLMPFSLGDNNFDPFAKRKRAKAEPFNGVTEATPAAAEEPPAAGEEAAKEAPGENV